MLVPGPGRYQPSTVDLISRNDAPKYGFGTSMRADIAGGPGGGIHSKRTLSQDGGKGDTQSLVSLKPLVPGPGAYEIKSVIGNEGPKRSLAGRFKIDLQAKELNYKPGPGQYTPSVNFAIKQSPNYKIGTSIREKYYLKDKFIHDLPPPNIYNPNYEKIKSKAPATGLGYGERSAMSKTFASPGPGAYKSPSAIGEGPTYVLGARLHDPYEAKKAKELPSPNHYNPKFDVLSKTQSVFSIGKSKR
jgi:Sperm-tail PG-rich repeat